MRGSFSCFAFFEGQCLIFIVFCALGVRLKVLTPNQRSGRGAAFFSSTILLLSSKILGLDSLCIKFCVWYDGISIVKVLHMRSELCSAICWICFWPSDQS